MEHQLEDFNGPYLDYMVDCETGGLAPHACPMIQLAAVRFSLQGKAIASERAFFKASLQEDMWGRRWDASTQSWWESMPETYAAIVSVAEPSQIVLQRFVEWVAQDNSGPWKRRFWAKPSHFDFPFIESYFQQTGLLWPFHFREATDLNSYLRGRGIWDVDTFWKGIEKVEPAHDALSDCLTQIRGLFAC